ncbi:hypothetical protein EV644_12414 [Kribbella orskensis]|uniref:Uncharacterized protein n=1 Tax=Kribbella orskensis TaxID=2512216 RepID=A0ABY2BCM0_9ACTN|nr:MULTISPECIES: hypothetical protein [Kribbella]TCN32792.1 hypothetical protein EV642_12684 [Kribbella sp. VKM Ac-2500]TCO12890.1 hypothetical protein EV644_12414 [Kribbella orskensis]
MTSNAEKAVPAVPAAQGMTPTPTTVGMTRLNPFDGLFLRAEHLDAIQAYARSLSCAVGQAGGSGVVHGYAITVKDSIVTVSPGLAIAADGRPLLLTSTVQQDLTGSDAGTGDIRVIEVLLSPSSFGDENVYGELCGDPCADGVGTTRPYVAEGVTVRITDVQLEDTGIPAHRTFRSHVAAAWFEKERRSGRYPWKSPLPWLTTSEGDKPADARLIESDWGTSPTAESDGAVANSSEPVAIGLLLRTPATWEVDPWIARRDRIDTQSHRGWQQRLGMRPWDVFIAQILQFENMLLRYWRSGAALAPADYLKALDKVERALQRDTEIPSAEAKELVGPLKPSGGASAASKSFELMGIHELPPAGYLPCVPGTPIEPQVKALFPNNYPLHLCACRPDFVAHAVEEAQHLDRIRLDKHPRVDILVPVADVPTQMTSTLSTNQKWVAFRRRREQVCILAEPKYDDVPIVGFVVDDQTAYTTAVDELMTGKAPNVVTKLGTARYPLDGWAPPSAAVQADVVKFVLDSTGSSASAVLTVVALVRSVDRRSLGAVRASLLLLGQEPPIESSVRTAVGAKDSIYIAIWPGSPPSVRRSRSSSSVGSGGKGSGAGGGKRR